MQEELPNTPGGTPLFAWKRTHQQRSIDVFKGDTDDRMSDDAYADVRETKGIKLYNNLRRVNALAGDPFGIGEYLPPLGDQPSAGPVVSDTGHAPPASETHVLGVRDP